MVKCLFLFVCILTNCSSVLCVGAIFLFACVGVECCVAVAVWYRTCALVAPAPACGLAGHTDVGSGFDSTSPPKVFENEKLGRHD